MNDFEVDQNEVEHALSVEDAAEHVRQWTIKEYNDYSSKTKYSSEARLQYLRDDGLETGSRWLSLITRYWDRGEEYEALRTSSEPSEEAIVARQYFAKHTDAVRALLSTVIEESGTVAWSNLADYRANGVLLNQALHTTESTLPSNTSPDFNLGEHWNKFMQPLVNKAQIAINETMGKNRGLEGYKTAEAPLASLLRVSFDVVVAYVYRDGLLPQPALPGGEVKPWVEEIDRLAQT